MVEVSWQARVITTGRFNRDYHLYERNRIPSTRLSLLMEIDNACGYAYIFHGLTAFILQCWKLPEVRKFHRSWIMDFEAEVASSHSKPKIKTASFDTSEKALWRLREDFRNEGMFKPDPIVRLVDPVVNPWTSGSSATGTQRQFELNARKHSSLSRDFQDSSPSHNGPSLPRERFGLHARKHSIMEWKESIGATHSSD